MFVPGPGGDYGCEEKPRHQTVPLPPRPMSRPRQTRPTKVSTWSPSFFHFKLSPHTFWMCWFHLCGVVRPSPGTPRLELILWGATRVLTRLTVSPPASKVGLLLVPTPSICHWSLEGERTLPLHSRKQVHTGCMDGLRTERPDEVEIGRTRTGVPRVWSDVPLNDSSARRGSSVFFS